MNSYVQLITSKPVMTNVANSLRIPTVQGKTIIKMKSPPRPMCIRTITDSPDQKIPIISSTLGTAKSEPLSSDKTGGLFDTDEEVDKSYLDMDFEHLDFADLNNIDNNYNQSADLTPSPVVANQTTTQMPKKKFSDKLSDANLKIKIVKSDLATTTTTSGQILTGATGLLDLDLEDLELSKIMTPSIEKECLQYLQAINTDENGDFLKSAHIISNNQILNSLGLSDDADLESMLKTGLLTGSAENNNVFLTQTSPKVKPPALTLNSSTDHVYSNSSSGGGAANKRPITSVLEGDDTSSASFVSDALNSSVSVPGTSASLTSGAKRQRTRGIYRAEDITNEEDLQNYLERRKKNNISSKISRANKKNQYSQMDERCVVLENENSKLEVKVKKLEELNKLMKDYLIENFSNKIK